MHNLSKLACILPMISLLALPLTGCDSYPWDSASALILKVDTPKDGTTVNAPTVTVAGRVSGSQSAGAKITINDAVEPVRDGKFSVNVTLTEGQNVLNIVATSGGAAPKETVTVTYKK
ncbi:MAG: hypothetical protein LLG97_16345 [Deltaproteobacteria bacterium]|nr:hypothetical protein [Deltaproteobacteria bacterium]